MVLKFSRDTISTCKQKKPNSLINHCVYSVRRCFLRTCLWGYLHGCSHCVAYFYRELMLSFSVSYYHC